MAVDEFFTPPELAARLISLSSLSRPSAIADFCAGDGELLRAASKRWPGSKLFATDLSRPSLTQLSRTTTAKTGRCDFMAERSRQRCRVLQGLLGKVNLVVLNPPFSHRGGYAKSALFQGEHLRASPALNIIVNSLPYLTRDGELLTVMPVGCLRSQKNEAAWLAIGKHYEVTIENYNHHRVFSQCVPRTALVRLKKKRHSTSTAEIKATTQSTNGYACTSTARGRLAVHRAVQAQEGEESVPFIHTSSLRNSQVNEDRFKVARAWHEIRGFFVLIPRVGKPDVTKIAVLETAGVVLSDCVIAVRCSNRRQMHTLRNLIAVDWNSFERLYRGTGAPYLTLRDVNGYLASRHMEYA